MKPPEQTRQGYERDVASLHKIMRRIGDCPYLTKRQQEDARRKVWEVIEVMSRGVVSLPPSKRVSSRSKVIPVALRAPGSRVVQVALRAPGSRNGNGKANGRAEAT